MDFYPAQLPAVGSGVYLVVDDLGSENYIITATDGGSVTIIPHAAVWTNAQIPETAAIVTFTAPSTVTLTAINIRTSALSNLVHAGSMGALANLTTVTITPITTAPVLGTIILTGAALSSASVNGIIAACVAGGTSDGTLNLSGGTNAAPSGGAIADIATLTSRGWTLTTN